MAFSREFVLKSIAGLVAVGGAAGSMFYGKNIVGFFDEGVKKIIFNLGDGEQDYENREDELGIPLECKTNEIDSSSRTISCELTEEQLRRVKFARKNYGFPIKVKGLVGDNRVNLTIEEVEGDEKNYPKGKKYTFSNRSTSTITISGTKYHDIVLKANEGSEEFREMGEDGRLENVRKLDDLGIPVDCKEGKECYLDDDYLKKIKFKDLGDSDLSIEGLEKNETIELIVEKVEDAENYPKGRKYTFDNSLDLDIKIDGLNNGSVTLEKLSESYFKEKDGRLIKVSSTTKLEINRSKRITEVNGILENLGIEGIKITNDDFTEDTDFQQKTIDLDKESLGKIKFWELNGAAERNDLEEGKKIKLALDYTKRTKDYPKNIKLTFTNETGKNVKLEKGDRSIVIKKPNGKNNDLEMFKVEGGKLVRSYAG